MIILSFGYMFHDHDLLTHGHFFVKFLQAVPLLTLLLMAHLLLILQSRESELVESIRIRQAKVSQAHEAIVKLREEIQTMSAIVDANTEAVLAAEENLAAIRLEMSSLGEPEGVVAAEDEPMATGTDQASIGSYAEDESEFQQAGLSIPEANMMPMDATYWGKETILECTVFWTNIPTAWTEQELLDFMNTVGGTYSHDVYNVVAINVAYGPDSMGQGKEVARGYALFLFATRALAEFAIQHVSHIPIEGKRAVLRFSTVPMDFRGRRGQCARGRTRTGRYLWDCPKGAMDGSFRPWVLRAEAYCVHRQSMSMPLDTYQKHIAFSLSLWA